MIKAKLNRKKCQLIHGPGRVHFTLVIRDFELRCYGNISYTCARDITLIVNDS